MLPHQRTLLKLMDGYFHNSKTKFHGQYTQAIPPLYMELVGEILSSIKRSLATEPIVPEPQLPALGEGVVLAAQCSQALLLHESDLPLNERLTLKCIVSQKSIEVTVGLSIIIVALYLLNYIIETLKLLDLLLPRLQFGKTIPSPLARPQPDSSDAIDPAAFPYLKRDLLRLLGILSYENRLVQDRMRACGGVEVVMNHCVVDETNPCTSM